MVFWVKHLFNAWILLNSSPFHLPLSSHHLAFLELCSCSCPRADHPISGQCCQVSQCACSRMAFHPKGLCITDRGKVTPECPGEQSLQQGSWLWVAMGVGMSTWIQSPPPPSSCVSPSLSSPGFLWHHSIKGATRCCQPVATKIMKRLHFGGRCSVEGKFYLCSPCCPSPTSQATLLIRLFTCFNVFAQIVRTCYILELDFTGFSHLYIEVAETGLTQTSCL